MDLFFSDPYAYLDTFLLVFVRILGVMLIVPVLGNGSIPALTKASFALFLSLIMINVAPVQAPVSSGQPIAFGVVVILEFVTGYLIGFSAYVVFSILSLAGQFIDMQIGFSMVNVFDPMSQIQLTITGNLYYYILMMITIVTNAYHFFIRAMVDSFRAIPLGGMVLSPGLYDAIIRYMVTFFDVALRIASPIFFVMLITNVVLGVLARAVPQLNMFVIGFPIKILFGLITIYIMLTSFKVVSDNLIEFSIDQMYNVIRGMMP